MERTMPIDLENPELKRKLLGYETKAVDRLLLGAAKTLQQLLFENAALREEVERQKADASQLREQEHALKDILVLAQRTADEIRVSAHKQAEATVEEARQATISERMASQQKLSETRWEIERLRAERARYAEDFRALLERHQRELAYVVGLTVVHGEALDAASGS